MHADPSQTPDDYFKDLLPEKSTTPPWPEQLPTGFCSSQALMALSIRPREPLIDDWCRIGDLGFIFAARGVGKTWLSMHLAHGVATLAAVGPWKVHRQLKTLYLDGEMPPADLKERDRLLGEPTEELVYVNHEILFERTGSVMNLADLGLQEAILALCKSNGFGLLCLDNLSSLASGMDENKAIDWELIQPWLLRLRRAHITVIFIHHGGRSGQMRGSSKREDPAFWIIRLDDPQAVQREGEKGAHFISRFTKWRNAATVPPSYEWWYKANGKGELDLTFKESGPLAIFRSLLGEGLDTATEIAEAMDISKGYVSRLAARAQSEGWLRKIGRSYALID